MSLFLFCLFVYFVLWMQLLMLDSMIAMLGSIFCIFFFLKKTL